MDKEDAGNNTIVLRDDVAEEDAVIMDVMDEKDLGFPHSINSSNLKLKTQKSDLT